MNQITLYSQLKEYIQFANLKFTHENTMPTSPQLQSYKYDTKLLTKREQDNIYGLHLFMKINPNVSDDMLQTLFSDNSNDFKTLRSLCHEYPGFISDLRNNGFDLMCRAMVAYRKLGKTSHSV